MPTRKLPVADVTGVGVGWFGELSHGSRTKILILTAFRGMAYARFKGNFVPLL